MGDLDVAVLARDLAINLVGLFFVGYVSYFRRHRRRDVLVGYVAFNISLFSVAAALSGADAVTVGVGFGLFAVLSIVRLRSEEATRTEIGYTMVVLVLGVLCGLPGLEVEYKLVLGGLLVIGMLVIDHPAVVREHHEQRSLVVLDHVMVGTDALRSTLRTQLGGDVREHVIREIDFVRETMTVEVSWRPDAAPHEVVEEEVGRT